MNTRFDRCFELVIGHEGSFTDDRRDRGNWTSGVIGKGQLKGTKYGVSAMSYPNIDIKNLTLDQAKEIYRKDFWNKNKCDELPAGIDYLVFDSAINHGGSRAIRFLQAACNVPVDGVIGPKTIAAANSKNVEKIISEFCVTRGLFYTNIGTFQTYKKGWFRRLFDTHAQALADAKNESVVHVEPEHVCATPTNTDDESDKEKAFWQEIVKMLNEAAERIAKTN